MQNVAEMAVFRRANDGVAQAARDVQEASTPPLAAAQQQGGACLVDVPSQQSACAPCLLHSLGQPPSRLVWKGGRHACMRVCINYSSPRVYMCVCPCRAAQASALLGPGMPRVDSRVLST